MYTKQISIAFFFPYRSIGGASILFLRLSEILSKMCQVTLIDYEDGYMASRIPKGVFFLPVHKVNELAPESIVVFQSTPAWRIEALEKFPNSCKLFFWNLHPRNIYGPLLPNGSLQAMRNLINSFSGTRIDKLKSYICWLIVNDAISFMDIENLKATEHSLGSQLTGAQLLPLITDGPLSVLDLYAEPKPTAKKLNAIWIGRLESFKTPVLEKLIRDLSGIEGHSIRLTVVGEGEDKSLLESVAANMSESLSVNFVGEMTGTALANEIVRSDVGFCMGTSALDVAKYNVPTVCLDYSYEIINYPINYRFLFEVEGFTLARELDGRSVLSGRKLSNLIDDIVGSKDLIASQCEDYWSINHSPRTVEHFIDRISETKITFRGLKKKRFHKAPMQTRLINTLIFLSGRKSVETDVYKL